MTTPQEEEPHTTPQDNDQHLRVRRHPRVIPGSGERTACPERELDVETSPAENLPPDLAAIPAEKPGSK